MNTGFRIKRRTEKTKRPASIDIIRPKIKSRIYKIDEKNSILNNTIDSFSVENPNTKSRRV
ncbi:MAG: hypothetical protein ACLFNK_01385 [Candidatus Woesearchaeota archaeon]